jgi:ABC-type transport system substrate-binding protein
VDSERNAQVWTYKLRPNVQFQNGQITTVDDVVATYKRLTDPNGDSQALSAFRGVPDPGRRMEGRRPHGRVPSGRAERELPT